YISVGVEVEKKQEELTDISLGIDLGLKDLAICSDGQIFKNINKTKKVKKLEKRLKQKQKQISRKYEMNKIKKEGGVSC
ncbi:transposase, partial [Fusobacterium mortiferum]